MFVHDGLLLLLSVCLSVSYQLLPTLPRMEARTLVIQPLATRPQCIVAQ